MKKVKSNAKIATVASCLLAASVVTAPVSAGEFMHHGTSCMTADLAQGALFSWNKDGLTNNFINDLFVICPVTLDDNAWDGDATEEIDIEIEIFMPPNYTSAFDGSSQGPRCLLRVGETDSGTPPTDDLIFDVNELIIVGTFDGDSTDGDYDTGTSFIETDGDTDNSSHILCLIPEGGTIARYSVEQL